MYCIAKSYRKKTLNNKTKLYILISLFPASKVTERITYALGRSMHYSGYFSYSFFKKIFLFYFLHIIQKTSSCTCPCSVSNLNLGSLLGIGILPTIEIYYDFGFERFFPFLYLSPVSRKHSWVMIQEVLPLPLSQ